MALNGLRRFWRQLFVIAVPLVFLPLPLIIGTKPACCAYVIVLMGIFWLSEVVPMAVVSLLPAILFPMLAVQSSKDVCRNYFKDSVMLFVGSLIVAVAVEESNLHKRIALRVLLLVGSHPRWLMLGFMCISGFLSMWMSNTATTAMITPIAETVIMELFKRKRAAHRLRPLPLVPASPRVSTRSPSYIRGGVAPNVHATAEAVTRSISQNGTLMETYERVDIEGKDNQGFVLDADADGHSTTTAATVSAKGHGEEEPEALSVKDLDADELKIIKGMILCVAYAANIGGTGTLTGTLPNIVFKGQIDALYGPSTGVNFATFLLFSFPGMLLTLIVAFIWLQWMFISTWSCGKGGKKKTAVEDDVRAAEQERTAVRQMIQSKYNELGIMGFGEASVMFLFIFLIVAWMFRSPHFITGWQEWFPKGYVTDATPAMLVCFLLFIWPKRLTPAKNSKPGAPIPPILTWGSMKRRFPWDVFLLLGGAIALADGTQASGLTDWLKDQMHYFASLPPWAIVMVISLLIATVTEFASNGAIATIFLPILAKLAEVSDVNPLYYMIPATIACSFAFMLPVATPPNAIAFGCGFLQIWDMVKAGFMLNLIAIIILIVNVHTTGVGVFDLLNKPAWLLAEQMGLSNDDAAGMYNMTTMSYATT